MPGNWNGFANEFRFVSLAQTLSRVVPNFNRRVML
jgi:hypothetical protein